jgi:hypothetical protein
MVNLVNGRAAFRAGYIRPETGRAQEEKRPGEAASFWRSGISELFEAGAEFRREARNHWRQFHGDLIVTE